MDNDFAVKTIDEHGYCSYETAIKLGFGYRAWDTMFHGFKKHELEIHLVGVCTDICVITNALLLKTYFPEAKIIVDASCCAGSTPDMHQKALDVMRSCQIDVIND